MSKPYLLYSLKDHASLPIIREKSLLDKSTQICFLNDSLFYSINFIYILPQTYRFFENIKLSNYLSFNQGEKSISFFGAKIDDFHLKLVAC